MSSNTRATGRAPPASGSVSPGAEEQAQQVQQQQMQQQMQQIMQQMQQMKQQQEQYEQQIEQLKNQLAEEKQMIENAPDPQIGAAAAATAGTHNPRPLNAAAPKGRGEETPMDLDTEAQGGQPQRLPQQQEQQQQLPAPRQQAAQQQKQQQAQYAAATAPRLSAIEPKELKYTEANRPEVLEEWIFRANRMLIQQGQINTSFQEQLVLLSSYWDFSVTRWWEAAVEQEQQGGKAVSSWEELQKALKANFLSTADEDKAVDEMHGLQMNHAEAMDIYVQRAAAIIGRIRKERMTPEAAAEQVAKGISPIRFPYLVSTYKREQKEHRDANNGKGINFNAVRQRLTALAQAEPSEVAAEARRSAGVGTSSNSSSSSSSSGSSNKSATRWALAKKLNAIVAKLDEACGETEIRDSAGALSEQEIQVLNALTGNDRSKIRCFRCQAFGHTIGECRKPDTRTCYNCGDKGHISTKCNKPKQQRSEGQPSEKPKNQ